MTSSTSAQPTHPQPRLWRFADREWDTSRTGRIMGILNVTPDSFSDGGEHDEMNAAVARAKQMIEEGADMIDVGGESTRPGAAGVSVEEEIRRTLPVIERLAAETDVPVSIDTSTSAVARAALDAGAAVVNDVTALTGDPEMVHVVADSTAGVVLMHMRGTPRTMQKPDNLHYADAAAEVGQYLRQRLEFAEAHGIARERVALDPGIGFGKLPQHNHELLLRIPQIRCADRPILMGPSRKSFLGRILDNRPPQERVWATAAAVACTVLHGADIVRVHDVAIMRDAARVAAALRSGL